VAADDGELASRIAVLLRVIVSYVSNVLGRRRLTGQTTERSVLPQRSHVPPKLADLNDTDPRRPMTDFAAARRRY
jgi:hypothetical protein